MLAPQAGQAPLPRRPPQSSGSRGWTNGPARGQCPPSSSIAAAATAGRTLAPTRCPSHAAVGAPPPGPPGAIAPGPGALAESQGGREQPLPAKALEGGPRRSLTHSGSQASGSATPSDSGRGPLQAAAWPLQALPYAQPHSTSRLPTPHPHQQKAHQATAQPHGQPGQVLQPKVLQPTALQPQWPPAPTPGQQPQKPVPILATPVQQEQQQEQQPPLPAWAQELKPQQPPQPPPPPLPATPVCPPSRCAGGRAPSPRRHSDVFEGSPVYRVGRGAGFHTPAAGSHMGPPRSQRAQGGPYSPRSTVSPMRPHRHQGSYMPPHSSFAPGVALASPPPPTTSLAAVARGSRSCGGSFGAGEGRGADGETTAEAWATEEACVNDVGLGPLGLQAREALKKQGFGREQGAGGVSFTPCLHYVPSRKAAVQEENLPVARSSPPPTPQLSLLSAPPSRQQLLSFAPRSPRANHQGPAPPQSWQPLAALPHGPPEPVLVTAAPVAFDDGEEASESPASEQFPVEFHLDPIECIPYNELDFIEHIGSGEFGTVCRGRFQDKEVAIKELFWDDTMKEEVVFQDLAKEVESFRHLRHKRLVTFIGACLEIPHPCLVTEYMPGGSLHHLLHVKKTRLPLLHGINMCMQLADGVRYLHSQDPVVVHRDLKTQNVVLDLNLNLKLCDFGLTESMERTHITKRNNGGSPRYMAPELFELKTKITEKVDLWAMGCIFIEIFGGTLPYDNITSLAELTRELLVHKRPPCLPEALPDDLGRIISECHNFDYRLRPSSNQVFEHLGDCKKYLRQVGGLPEGASSKASCRSSEPGGRSRRSRTAGAGA